MCGLKAAQIHGRPCRATKEPVAVLYSLLPYGKNILISRHLSSMLFHDAAGPGASSSYHLRGCSNIISLFSSFVTPPHSHAIFSKFSYYKLNEIWHSHARGWPPLGVRDMIFEQPLNDYTILYDCLCVYTHIRISVYTSVVGIWRSTSRRLYSCATTNYSGLRPQKFVVVWPRDNKWSV